MPHLHHHHHHHLCLVKDYLNSRYTDKRNILAVYIGKQLSQKKYRHVIGSVHLTHIFGDANKIGLLLTPPTTTTVDERKIVAARKPKRNGNDDIQEKGSAKLTGKKKSTGVNKPRFPIRLIFGVKEQHQQQSMTKTNGQSDNNGEESAGSDDDNDGVYPSVQQQIEPWIPLSRLLPNRNNNRAYATATGGQQQLGDDKVDIPNNSGGGRSTTPHYTNSIVEDIHFLSTTRLINTTIASLSNATSSSTSASSSITTTPFHLLKGDISHKPHKPWCPPSSLSGIPTPAPTSTFRPPHPAETTVHGP
jgi:hypothetical protein